MHYKNGREAKPGDKVVVVEGGTYEIGKTGVIHDLMPGASTCNAYLAPCANSQLVSLGNCLHIDDVVKAIVPDTSQPAGAAAS